jgi:hypothetical protein
VRRGDQPAAVRLVFTPGATHVVHTATRQDGTTTTATQQVFVTGPPPVITGASASPNVLWAPNHRLVEIAVAYQASNACGGGGITTSLAVSSNEPVLGPGGGSGDTSPDWVVVNNRLVQVRNERAGTGTGRIYTIEITASDEYGQTATELVFVSVPHDQRR